MHATALYCGHLCMTCDMHVHVISKHHKHKNIGPDIMGISNFSTLVFLINNWASIISKSPIWSMLKFWPDPHLFKSPGPKTPFGPFIVTPYNFGLLAQSIAQSENNFLGPIPISGSSRSKTILGLSRTWAQSH